MFRQEYPATPDEAFIATGQCVFDKEKIILRREEVKGAKWEKGIFRFDYDGTHVTDIRWEEDENGPIRIHMRPVATLRARLVNTLSSRTRGRIRA